MKITILGAGAMGCLFAAYLCKENDVTLIDSYVPAVEKISSDGVKVSERDKNNISCKPSVFESGKCKVNCDLLIVFVKDTATEKALADNIAVVSENTIVLSLQNGMGNDEVIKKFVSEEKILLGTTKHNSITVAPGEVMHSGYGVTNIGSVCGNTEMAQKIVDVFNSCGIETKYAADVKYLLWEKLFVNMTINSTTALLGTTIDFLGYNSPSDPLITQLLDEAVAVAKADGAEFDAKELKNSLYALCASMPGGKASMRQDMEKGRKTEIDFINGSVVRLGKKYDIPTPTHSAMVALVHSKEKLVCKE